VLAAIGTYYDIVGAQGILQAGSHLSALGRGEKNTGSAIAKQAASTISGFVPGSGLMRSVTDLLYGPVDRSSVDAAAMASLPVVNVLYNGHNFNRFGDVLGDQTWYGKLARTGIPIAFRISDDSPQNRALYGMLVNKGADPPAIYRYRVENKYGPIEQGTWEKFAKKSGDILKQNTMDNLESLQEMPPEAVKTWLAKAGQLANNQAASDIGLEPQKAPKARASAGGGGGGSDAAAVPPVPKLPKIGGETPAEAKIGGFSPRGGVGGVPSVRLPGAVAAAGRGGTAAGPSRVAASVSRAPRLVRGRVARLLHPRLRRVVGGGRRIRVGRPRSHRIRLHRA
jgi:hypothetical protein